MTVPDGPVVAVTAVDHPDLDDWVRERAALQAADSGVTLGPYLGREDVLENPPAGLCCHLFAVEEET